MDEWKDYRGSPPNPGKESPCRNRSIEESLRLFEEMRAGKHADGSLCVRAKIDMVSSNIQLRDPVIYRILHSEHPNTGAKWCVYPTYDFARPRVKHKAGIDASPVHNGGAASVRLVLQNSVPAAANPTFSNPADSRLKRNSPTHEIGRGLIV